MFRPKKYSAKVNTNITSGGIRSEKGSCMMERDKKALINVKTKPAKVTPSYTGIEQIQEFYNKVIKRFANWQGTKFFNADFTLMDLTVTDYVLASGSLNYKSADPDFTYKIITKLYASCSRGMAFNLLCDIIPNDLIVAYDPQQILTYCQTLSAQVKLIDNYADEDFTIYMYR